MSWYKVLIMFKKFFKQLISDNNHINEQTFVGVLSFFAMILVLLVNAITGIMGKEFVVKEFIFDGFLTLTLGTFGITTAGRIWTSKKQNEDLTEGDKNNV